MRLNKKFLGSGAVVMGLVATVLSFQNCSQNQAGSTASTSTSDTSSGGTTTSATTITYPNTSTPIILTAGQSVTLKIVKPSTLGDISNYLWYAYNDGHALAAHFGLPVESNGYLYISLTVRSDFTTTSQDVRVYLYNYSTGTYFDSYGVWVRMMSSTSNYFTGDAASEICSLRSSYVPTFNYTKTGAITDALYVFDNGAGIGNLSCSFTDSAGTTSSAVDCLNTSLWPSDWASKTLNLYSTNRCGTSYSHSY